DPQQGHGTGDAAGDADLTAIEQPVYAPLRAGLEGARARGASGRSHRQLRRRLRDLLSRDGARSAAMVGMMSRLKLTVNEAKTHVCCMPEGTFDFLGFTFGRYYSSRTGRASLQYWPSRKRAARLCGRVSEMTGRKWLFLDDHERIVTLNRVLVGWRNY